jgi:glycosyltransferase involved in cell wall biosynthesis
MQTMKFTIFTSCYNQAAYLVEAIESVLNQTYTDFEYLIYDDGSTDNTWEIIQSYAAKDSRIKAVKLDKQKNVACVLNRSIRDMSTDFWLWCPSDDVWCRNLLEVKAKYAAEHPDKVVYSNFTHINEKGLEIGSTTIKLRTPDEFRRAAYSSPIGFTGILIPKTALELVGPFPEHFWFSEDFYWMYKAATFDKVDFVGDSRFLYSKRIHSNRLTARRSSEDIRLQVELAMREVKALLSRKRINAPPIPKKIFFYWGNPVMSWLRYMTLYSFRKFNPDWQMELHVSHIDMEDKYWHSPETQDFHSYTGKNYLSEVKKLGIKIKKCPVFAEGAGPSHNSNFFKWNELATDGGIYCDMDVLFTKPIDNWYESVKHYQTGLSYEHTREGYHGGYYSIGFMFSSGNNRFFKDVFNSCTKHFDLNVYQGAGVRPLYKMLEDNGVGMRPYIDGLHYIPMNIVYPWRWKDQRDFFSLCHTKLPKETIGIHWFAGHPEAQEFNNNVNPDTLDSYNNTMSYWLGKNLLQ